MPSEPSGRPTSNPHMGVVAKIALALVVIVPTALLGGLFYLYSLQPEYSGRLTLAGLQDKVEVIFDAYGIPHIYARNEEDVYFALGFVHARECLFQMEMMRRVGAGRLSEIFGQKLVKTDKFFRTLGIAEQAQIIVSRYFNDIKEPWQKPLNVFFNVGPFAAMGGNETIANLGFRLNSPGRYPVTFGPAMRIMLDFADLEHSLSVNPTGESGYFLSAHYADQVHLFNTGKFRKQMMNREEIKNLRKGTLILKPE